MKLYIDSNKLEELIRNFNEIKILFPLEEQKKMERFLKTLKQNGYCESKDVDNIYAILENKTKQNNDLETIERTSTKDNVKKNKQLFNVLNELVLFLNLRYYFSEKDKTKEICKKHILSKEKKQ